VKLPPALIFGAFLMVAIARMARSQAAEPPASDPNEARLSGTAVSVSKNTLIVRTQANTDHIFVFDHDTIKPGTIPPGVEVTVTSLPTGEPGLRLARVVTLGRESAHRGESGDWSASRQQPAAIPAATKRLQNDIERHTRNVVFGVRAGIGLDPEVIDIGMHARMGPLFHRDIQFRPSVEFGFGEVTKFFAANPDVSYRLPLTPRWSTWSTYLAAGPSFGFSQQHFEKGGSSIDWGNLEFAPGLNVVAGLESRRGFLVEFRSTIYASPNPIFRMMFGYSF
jgi:hypothetical protein